MRTIPPGIAPPVRRGSTLTEVLVALMIMSIGLVSLATLFPLATLRAAKAVQMTAATDLRYNADTLQDMQISMARWSKELSTPQRPVRHRGSPQVGLVSTFRTSST